jgi:ATP-binding protein involved in chromosome partitioning
VLDLDLYAPDIPAMLGIAHRPWTHSFTLAQTRGAAHEAPVEREGMQIVSTGFLLGEDQPMGLEAQTLELLARHLIHEVRWSPIDFLVVDMPAGTSAVQPVLARLLKVDGALVVVTPQRVAHLDAQKVVRLYRHLRVPVLGAVENMSHLVCPHCGSEIAVFEPADPSETIWDQGVDRLARLPFAPEAERGETIAALAGLIATKLA